MFRIAVAAISLIVSAWGTPTLQTMKKEHRVAIVVGNGNYDENAIDHAETNARNVKKFLEENGFYVYYGENLDKRNFVRLLRKFNKNLHPNGIGLVYYCGHAVQTKGKNYLLPVDNGILNESMIARKSIALNSIYSNMEESYDRLNIVVLDTAYDAPFGTLFTPQKKGLAKIKSSKAQVTFMATPFGTANSSTSFTKDFVHLAREKGVELTALESKLIKVRQQQRQPKPQVEIVRNQPFYFVLPDHLPSADELAYSKIQNSDTKSALEKFINTYPKSRYTPKVRARLDAVKKQELEAQAAEAARQAKKREEDAAKAKAVADKEAETKIAQEREAAQKAAEEKNDISFILTKPEDVVETKPVKPKEGEERQIHLE